MKKVAIIYHYFAHYRHPIINALAKDKEIEFHFFSGKTTDTSIKTIDTNYSIYPIEERGFKWNFFENIWLGNLLWQKGGIFFALKNDYDAIIILGSPYHITTWAITIISRLRHKHVAFWTHGYTYTNISITNLIRDIFHVLPHGFLLYGNRAKSIIESKTLLHKKKVGVIYNSLAYETHLSLRSSLSSIDRKRLRKKIFGDDCTLVVFIGRLTKIKKLELILNMQKVYQNDFSQKICSIFIGDGEARTDLILLAESLGITGQTHFMGASYNEKLNAEILYSSDMCISPGNIGLTAMHSLVFGTPVITHDDMNIQMPEAEAVIEKKTGFYFKKDSLESLVEAVRKWHYLNKEEQIQMRINCQNIIDTLYNPSYQVQAIKNYLIR